MAKGKRICKVCGAEYEYCRTKYRNKDTFRYQDVACSPEHGSEYFAAILASRSTNAITSNETVETSSEQEATVPVDNDEKSVSGNETVTDSPETDSNSNESFIDEGSSSEIDIS